MSSRVCDENLCLLWLLLVVKTLSPVPFVGKRTMMLGCHNPNMHRASHRTPVWWTGSYSVIVSTPSSMLLAICSLVHVTLVARLFDIGDCAMIVDAR